MVEKYGGIILLSFFLGTITRGFMLRIDYRQFPSYPHSYIIHLTMGMIAAILGAIALPVLLEGEYIAITFLTLAAQQFREVRETVRNSLDNIEQTEIIPKGKAYIEGIAKLFEARNYLAFLTALFTSIIFYLSNWIIALIAGSIFGYLLHELMKSPTIGDIASVKIVSISVQKNNIGIGDLIMMNVGEKEGLEKWIKEGVGIKIIPNDENARATLFNLGQRQVILHDLSILMGIKLDEGLQMYTPLARIELEKGILIIIIVPQEPDEVFIKKAVEKIPVVESAQRKPLKSSMGLKAAD